MSVFKCKMCGGTIEFAPGATVGVCDSCGTRQTLPRLDDEKKENLYDRASHFRRNNDFDKAMGIYEQILNEDNTDAEAYWSLVLCRYGIEYVEDPRSHKHIPTVNRAQFTSVLADEDYKSALQYADGYQKTLYEAEARAIDEIQKGILEISSKEEPFDVFICYKESDAQGRRTQDSVLATELYHLLIEEGYKVFFSRITLEDKLGTAYEPYIFAALHSARIMVVLGTKPEYFNAAWVKNEWSRYLALIRNGEKKMLIPAYRDMDPYDLPEEFSHLQAQDMSKLGFMQDLIHGIKKIISVDAPQVPVKETVVVNTSGPANVTPLLKRVMLFLEDESWQEAEDYCERVLDQDPENARAYLGKLMAELHVRTQEQLRDCEVPFDTNHNYQKAVRFADSALEEELKGNIAYIKKRNEEARLTRLYNNALTKMNVARSDQEYQEAATLFHSIPGFRDAETLAAQCLEQAEESRKNGIYNKGVIKMHAAYTEEGYKAAAKIFQSIFGFRDADALAAQCLEKAEESRKEAIYVCAQKEARQLYSQNLGWKDAKEQITAYQEAIRIFQTIPGYKNSDEQVDALQKQIEEIKAKEEADRQEAARKAEESRIAAEKAAKKRKKAFAIGTPIVVACIAFVILLTTVIIPNSKYHAALRLYDGGQYEEAISAFKALNGYKDSASKIAEIKALLMKNVKVGDIIEFGTYEQDNNTSNGKEAIEWQVLAKEGTRILVISKYALDCQGYNTSYSGVTWETCTLRQWLNVTFVGNAFSAEEQARILSTTVSADKNPDYSTNPGNATTDKVFLLSIVEAEKYFTTDATRKCAPTAYTKAQGAWTSNDDKTASGEATCWWWLRSPGYDQFNAAGVYTDGSVGYGGGYVDDGIFCVRPALWVNLES